MLHILPLVGFDFTRLNRNALVELFYNFGGHVHWVYRLEPIDRSRNHIPHPFLFSHVRVEVKLPLIILPFEQDALTRDHRELVDCFSLVSASGALTSKACVADCRLVCVVDLCHFLLYHVLLLLSYSLVFFD